MHSAAQGTVGQAVKKVPPAGSFLPCGATAGHTACNSQSWWGGKFHTNFSSLTITLGSSITQSKLLNTGWKP